MTDRDIMQQALEALEQSKTLAPFGAEGVVYWEGVKIHEAAITALRERLAQPEQEPVAWRTFDGEGGYDYRDYDMNEHYDKEWAERNPNHAHWVEPLFVKEKK